MNLHAVGSAPGRDLDLVLTGESVVGLDDGSLLDRVGAGPSPAAEAAFAALVERHGPMVARVCSGILGNHHTAEDAVQAVFLVLLRRARSIRNPSRLAPWLYGVALRTARAARRRFPLAALPLDEDTMIDPTPHPAQATVRREQAELLYTAIARLPGRYLAPVVLCDLEGLTHAEAADRLQCPTSTVSIRLKRAREKLRVVLARHRLDFESILPPVPAAFFPRPLAASAAAHLLANRVAWTASFAPWKAALVAVLVADVATAGAQRNPQDPPPGGEPAGAAPAAIPVARQDPPEPKSTTDSIVAASQGKLALPVVREVRDYVDFSGRIAATRTSDVRSRVAGILSKIDVVEGELVQKGQPLLRIDDGMSTHWARQRVEGREANRHAIEAARRTLATLKADPKFSSTENPEFEAVLAQAEERAAQFERQYSHIDEVGFLIVTAPSHGAVSPRLDLGATLEADKTVIATVVAVDPIRVDFEVDEGSFLKIRRWLRTQPGTTSLPVQAALADEDGFPHAGRVLFQATQFDPGKGTCTLHAELPNADRALIPGLSTKVRVDYGDSRRAFLVPHDVFHGVGSNTFFWIIDDRGTVQQRLVTLGLPYRGGREVKRGIDAQTRVIVQQPLGLNVGITFEEFLKLSPQHNKGG